MRMCRGFGVGAVKPQSQIESDRRGGCPQDCGGTEKVVGGIWQRIETEDVLSLLESAKAHDIRIDYQTTRLCSACDAEYADSGSKVCLSRLLVLERVVGSDVRLGYL